MYSGWWSIFLRRHFVLLDHAILKVQCGNIERTCRTCGKCPGRCPDCKLFPSFPTAKASSSFSLSLSVSPSFLSRNFSNKTGQRSFFFLRSKLSKPRRDRVGLRNRGQRSNKGDPGSRMETKEWKDEKEKNFAIREMTPLSFAKRRVA